ncbi:MULTISPECIES: JAB domain-containing protein [Brevibacillus]|uniref:JAB domain-containing protein n=1 Tax=Brevibacillus TaxID=55080 RepID=UPI000D110A05|nr:MULTISPECIES: JAB domain-containing protein [Brevibacillus]MED1947203.1 JAB domain-containing protein [Brevibacillus formosus]MED1997530.1 JAB domain-containing protein [Brevibacillus formosus]MED2083387.1 JAB domain-containing protein [Brevibacillus formosus]PSK16795.1 DNA repair protein [Brevibacillus sp. NRRL NRS-603]
MRKQNLTIKPPHQHILKEAQLVDTLEALMMQVTHPQQLTTLSDDDIMRITCISSSTMKQLRATLNLADLLAVPQRRQQYTVRLPRDIVQYCMDNIDLNKDQGTYLFGLNTKNIITTTELITKETMQCFTAYRRTVFRHLIIHTCASGILVHIHSPGDNNPSQEQINLARQISDAGDIMGISILDVIVMTGTDYLSFKERDWL